MQANQVKISQREELGNKLKDLAPDISLSDKQVFLQNGPVKKSTLSAYLCGHVSNIDLAMDMLIFFRKRIAERKEEINAEI